MVFIGSPLPLSVEMAIRSSQCHAVILWAFEATPDAPKRFYACRASNASEERPAIPQQKDHEFPSPRFEVHWFAQRLSLFTTNLRFGYDSDCPLRITSAQGQAAKCSRAFGNSTTRKKRCCDELNKQFKKRRKPATISEEKRDRRKRDAWSCHVERNTGFR
jgi:hypothetical protein